MFNIEIIRDIRELAFLEPVWNTLLAASDMDVPFMTFEWFRMYWRLFEKRGEMLVCVLSRGKDTVAIVPLMRIPAVWRGIPHWAVTFIANYYSCRTGIINTGGQDVLEQALDRLRCEGVKYDIFYANFIPESSVTDCEIRRYISSRRLPFRAVDWNSSPYIRLPATWEEYLASREHHIRHNIRRAMKLFEGGTGYSVTAYSRPEEFGTAWEKLLTVSRNSWKFRTGTAIANKSFEHIFRSIARMAVDRGWFRMLILEHQTKPIAFTYELHYKKKLYSKQIGFDESYAQQGPGGYMNYRSIRDAIEAGYSEFDFLGKDEDHKRRLASDTRVHHKYIVFNSTPLGRILAKYEFSLIPLTKQALLRFRQKAPSATPDKTSRQPRPLYNRLAPATAPSPVARALRVFYMAMVGYPQR